MNKFLMILNSVLVVVVLSMGYLLYSQNNRIEELENKKPAIFNTSLPEGVLADIEVLKNNITEIRRLGPDSVYVVQSYVPRESEVHYVAEVDEFTWSQLMDIKEQLTLLQASGDTTGLAELVRQVEALKYELFNLTVDFDTYGTCLEACAGGSINENKTGEIVVGARLLYWNRFGIGLHGVIGNLHPTDTEDTEFGIGIFGDCRIPKMENVSGFIGGGRNFTTNEWNLRAGLLGYFN